MRRLGAVVVGVSSIVAEPGLAGAVVDTRSIVNVQVASDVSITGYDIDYALKYMNARTGRTRLVRGVCRYGPTRCVVVRFAAMPRINYYALGSPPLGAAAGYIHLATKSRVLSVAGRRRLFLHELGHTRNLGHASTCATVMFSWIYCGAKAVPYSFTAGELAILRRQ